MKNPVRDVDVIVDEALIDSNFLPTQMNLTTSFIGRIPIAHRITGFLYLNSDLSLNISSTGSENGEKGRTVKVRRRKRLSMVKSNRCLGQILSDLRKSQIGKSMLSKFLIKKKPGKSISKRKKSVFKLA